MKAILLFALLTASNAYSASCIVEVNKAFENANPKFTVYSIKRDGYLNPRETIPYGQTDISNSYSVPLEIYSIKASFMVGFGFAALVDPKNCSVVKILEVAFDI